LTSLLHLVLSSIYVHVARCQNTDHGDNEKNAESHEQGLLLTTSRNNVGDNDGVLSIDGLYNSVVTISLCEESTFTVTLHKSVQGINVFLLDRPDFSQHVEVNSSGARRSGQTSLVRPSVTHIGVLHDVTKLNLFQGS
jgi:hypothetical protein